MFWVGYICTYTYQNKHIGCHPGIRSKVNFCHRARHRIKAEFVVFLLRYWLGVSRIHQTPENQWRKVEQGGEFVGF